MKHAAPRKRGGRQWILPTSLALLTAVLVVVGFLSTSIVADFLSWWPIWLLLVGGGIGARQARLGHVKVSGIAALLTSLALLVLVYGHVVGWTMLPSAVPPLLGPETVAVERAALSVSVPEGGLRVGESQSGRLYEVDVQRRGGSVGVPLSHEQSQGPDISIQIDADSEPSLYTYSGWTIGLSGGPVWTLALEGEVDADLSGLPVANLQLSGSGEVSLGAAAENSPVTVEGTFRIEIANGQPVRVIGPAEIPADWVRTDSGASSPVEGSGWVISVVEGAVVEIVTR